MFLAIEGYLEERARRSSKEKFLAAMSKVADVEPSDQRDRWTYSEKPSIEKVLAEPRETYDVQENDAS